MQGENADTIIARDKDSMRLSDMSHINYSPDEMGDLSTAYTKKDNVSANNSVTMMTTSKLLVVIRAGSSSKHANSSLEEHDSEGNKDENIPVKRVAFLDEDEKKIVIPYCIDQAPLYIVHSNECGDGRYNHHHSNKSVTDTGIKKDGNDECNFFNENKDLDSKNKI